MNDIDIVMGELYVWGGIKNVLLSPKKVEVPVDVIDVKQLGCTDHHVVLVTGIDNDLFIYCCGI